MHGNRNVKRFNTENYLIEIVEGRELWVNSIKYDEYKVNPVLLGRDLEARIGDDFIRVTAINVMLGINLTVYLNDIRVGSAFVTLGQIMSS